jgi:hypothetical protein
MNLSQRTKLSLLSCIWVFGITFVVFFPSLEGDFLNWDDNLHVVTNPQIRSLHPGDLLSLFFTFSVASYAPLEPISYAIDYAIWGLDPWGFHLTNIVLHSVNACWVFGLCLMLLRMGFRASTPRMYVAAISAALLFRSIRYEWSPLHGLSSDAMCYRSFGWGRACFVISSRQNMLGTLCGRRCFAWVRWRSSVCPYFPKARQ